MPEQYEGQYKSQIDAYEQSAKYVAMQCRQVLQEMKEWRARALAAEEKLEAIEIRKVVCIEEDGTISSMMTCREKKK